MIKISKAERAFDIVNNIVLGMLALTMLLPFLNVLAKSLSSETAVNMGIVGIFPMGLQFGTYKYVLTQSQFINSFKVSVFITVVGNILSMLMTVICAYPLSKPHLRGRRVFMLIYIFTMLFSGGIVPNYLLMKGLNLLNTVWVLILPSMLSVFNMIVVKTFFEELPESVEESARMDGASNFTVLFRIILPMSLPVLASVGLFYAVSFWNSYFRAVMYITKPSLKPLQQYLYDMVTQSLNSDSAGNVDRAMNMAPDAIRSATIMVSTLPIFCLYPFLQKYFVKGITIGSVKG